MIFKLKTDGPLYTFLHLQKNSMSTFGSGLRSEVGSETFTPDFTWPKSFGSGRISGRQQ